MPAALIPPIITATTPRIAVFSDLEDAGADWFDQVIKSLSESGTEVLYFRNLIKELPNFEKDRQFWHHVSKNNEQPTPVIVFVDESVVKKRDKYPSLLHTLYEHTKKFAIVKINAGEKFLGEDKIGQQMEYQGGEEEKKQNDIVQDRVQHFTLSNLPLLGLLKKKHVCEVVESFMEYINSLLPNTKP